MVGVIGRCGMSKYSFLPLALPKLSSENRKPTQGDWREKMKRLLTNGCLIILFSICTVDIVRADASVPQTVEQTAASSILTGPIHFYQQYLSSADGHRCPMTPSCSGYAVQAIRRHGPFLGWIMACDRLMRCGRDELKRSPSVMTRHGIRCQDPLDNNDFWLR